MNQQQQQQQVKVSKNIKQQVISEDDESDLRRGPWTVDEDFTLINYIAHHGEGRWNSLARFAGLKRTGKSCRLRWLNYLRPDVRRGNITLEEQLLILELHSRWGNRWSKIAQHLPGRTDNEIKNYWRTRVQKHAKQLKCDVNSKQFKDTMRYLWMPRLVERIQAAASATTTTGSPPPPAVAASSSSAMNQACYNSTMSYPDMISDHQIVLPQYYTTHNNNLITPENSSTVASSDSFGTPVSELTESNYGNYHPVINGDHHQGHNISIDQDHHYCFDHQDAPIDHHHHHQIDSSASHGLNNSTVGNIGYSSDQLGMGFIDDRQNNHQWIMDVDGGSDHDSLWNVDDVWFLQNQFNSNF